MKSKHTTAIMILSLTVSILLFPSVGEARSWQYVGNGTLRFAVDRVCRDGVETIAGYGKIGPAPQPKPGDTASITLNTRLFQNSTLPKPGPYTLYPVELYGPPLTLLDSVAMHYHEEPINTGPAQDIHIYGSKHIEWTQLLDVGESVIVYVVSDEDYGSLPYDIVQVEDCYLNQLTIDRGNTTVIDNTHLFFNEETIPDTYLTYQLATIPPNGLLYLNGTPLNVGDTFSQADINNNQLTYEHNGNHATGDSFTYHLRATKQVLANSHDMQGNAYLSKPSIEFDATYLVNGDMPTKQGVFVRGVSNVDMPIRVSVASTSTEATDLLSQPVMSFDERYVAFASQSTELVPGDTNKAQDIFVRDRDTDANGIFDEPGTVSVTRISVASDGTQANSSSYAPSISDGGRYIAFESLASNLVDSDTNGVRDIFVHDRQTGETTRVSIAADGTEANASSSDADISEDGRHVTFESDATNLVVGDTNESIGTFVHYRGLTSEFTLAIESHNLFLPLINE